MVEKEDESDGYDDGGGREGQHSLVLSRRVFLVCGDYRFATSSICYALSFVFFFLL